MPRHEAKENAFKIRLDGAMIISRDHPTIDGRFVGRNDIGVFSTQHHGHIVVDLRPSNIFIRAQAVIAGSELARPVRPGVNKDLTQHASAISGHHKVNIGRRGRGKTHIGRNRQTGEIRELEIHFK